MAYPLTLSHIPNNTNGVGLFRFIRKMLSGYTYQITQEEYHSNAITYTVCTKLLACEFDTQLLLAKDNLFFLDEEYPKMIHLPEQITKTELYLFDQRVLRPQVGEKKEDEYFAKAGIYIRVTLVHDDVV